jgi:hypothetical protein
MTDIKGYKVLTDQQKDAINTIKKHEEQFLEWLKLAWNHNDLISDNPIPDKRWLSIARTHIEEASMAACRAIAQPHTVEFK